VRSLYEHIKYSRILVVVLSLFIAHLVFFVAFVFHVPSLFAICTIVSLVVFFDVRLSHLNKDYLLTYLII